MAHPVKITWLACSTRLAWRRLAWALVPVLSGISFFQLKNSTDRTPIPLFADSLEPFSSRSFKHLLPCATMPW